MNTPAHVVAGLWLLGDRRRPADAWPIAIGGFLPDATMVVFYLVEKGRGMAEATIWSERYYDPRWQTSFDLLNSLPLIAAVMAGAWIADKRALWLLTAAMGLHAVIDLPLHHDDGHRHLWPLTSWRFDSPISYWDPARYGGWVTMAEIVLVAIATVVLWRRYPQRGVRLLLGCVAGGYVAYFVYVAAVWL